MARASTRYMGAVTNRVSFHPPHTVIIPEIRFGSEPERSWSNGDSYVNDDLRQATLIMNPLEWVVHRRSWTAKGSASATASNIRNGKIPGPYYGQAGRFEVRPCSHPRALGEYSFLIREVRS